MIAAKKHSPFWLEVMKEVESRYKSPSWTWVGKHRKVINITGPRMFHHVAHNYPYPVTLLPTNVTLCSVCDTQGTTRGANPHVISIEGKSWNGWDTTVLNFILCKARIILLLLLILVLYFIYRFYVYKKYCKDNKCSV